MADERQLGILKKGAKGWNLSREQNRHNRPDLAKASLKMLDLRGADLSEANLEGADLWGADLRQADLSMANLRSADLTVAKLQGARLSEANLSRADLRGADLSKASLDGANLSLAQLTTAYLNGARLDEANLTGADLRGVSLDGADLRGADVSRVNMWKAKLRGAHVGGTKFSQADLSGATGLARMTHHAPSTIGIDTIYLSKGRIPEALLRGAGVPDEFIAFTKSLVANPTEFHSCFISHSTKDQEFAERLYADLQNRNVRCWYAPHDVQGGRKLYQQIDRAILSYEKLLLILSGASMKSEWVKTEIAKARKREEQEKTQVLFPVRLVSFEAIRDWECFDSDTGKDSAREIREYFIPDFSNWKKDKDSYKSALERLLRDLRAGHRPIDARADRSSRNQRRSALSSS